VHDLGHERAGTGNTATACGTKAGSYRVAGRDRANIRGYLSAIPRMHERALRLLLNRSYLSRIQRTR
jgi:hypothetical protein